jgi:cyclic pyranopterin phosphate synthase
MEPAAGELGLSHLNSRGEVRMVDVGAKAATAREAVAEGFLALAPPALALVAEGRVGKGDVLAVARVAAIQAAKRTSELIPLCHPLPLSGVQVLIEAAADGSGLRLEVAASTTAPTGVEMEALTAVSVAALTLYDMAKALEKSMQIEAIRLVSKTGGKSGDYLAT